MTLLTEAQVDLILSDVANSDAAGKLNVLGGGISFVGSQPGSPASVPFSVIAMIRVPRRYVGQTFALTLELHDVTTGGMISVPNDQGRLDPLRAQQAVTINPPVAPPGMALPDDLMIGHNVIMNFPNGLPLPQGHSFEWRVQIDGQSRHWFYRFHVLGPAPGVVFGGPMGPANIPGVGEYVVEPTQVESAGEPDEPTA